MLYKDLDKILFVFLFLNVLGINCVFSIMMSIFGKVKVV